MDALSGAPVPARELSAVKQEAPPSAQAPAGYVVTNEMYNVLYELYYQRCSLQRKPCLVLVRRGSHCRLDLDMTCSQLELTSWAQEQFRSLFSEIPVDELYADSVYCWATRVPNRHADRIAREILMLVDDERSSLSP
jgi:hypothetical protein